MVVFVGDNGATTEKRAGLNQDFAHAGNNGRSAASSSASSTAACTSRAS